MTRGILILLYVVEVMKYYLAYHLCFGEKARRFWIPLAGGAGYSIVVLFARNLDDTSLRIIMYVFSISAIFFAHLEKWKSGIFKIIILVFTLSCVEALFLTLVSVLEINLEIAVVESVRRLCANLLSNCTILIALLIKSRLSEKGLERLKNFAMKNVLILVILMALEMIFTIAGLNWARAYVDNYKFQVYSLVLCNLSYIGVGLLGIFSVYLERTNKKVNNLMENEIRLKDIQKHYYDTMLEREEDTRRYRHDMENHLICLNRLAKEGDTDLLQRYIGQMRQQMEEIQKCRYVTGNDILDILTSHYVALLNEDVSVSVSGQVQTSIDEMKLCTIYANLLQNAVEELQRCENPAALEINFQQGTEFSRILIRNSLSKKQGQKRSQRDKNHGIGLYNVKKAVEAVNGILELKKEADFFQAVVIFKSI